MRSILLLFVIFLGFLPAMCVANTDTSTMLSGVLDSLVMIISFDDNVQPLAIGSGFIVGKQGQIATNYHVLEGASTAVVKFVNKDEKYDVTNLIHLNPDTDLAVIKVETETKPLIFGDDELCKIGERIYVAGNPEGLEGTVSEGIISGFRKISDSFRLMQITAPVSPGSSGGPILSQRGEVVGIASASFIAGQNLNFGVPVAQLKELMKTTPVNKKLDKENLPVSKKEKQDYLSTVSDMVKVRNVVITTSYSNHSGDIKLSIATTGSSIY